MSLHSDTHHHLRSKLAPKINLNLDKTLDKMINVEERQRNVLNSAMGGHSAESRLWETIQDKQPNDTQIARGKRRDEGLEIRET